MSLAFLVTLRAFSLLDRSVKDIVGVTMPGFATSGKTEINANELMGRTGVNKRVVDVSTACKQNFDDIGHDEGLKDITYENVQARERTQILMNLANKEGGLVVGTSDLSELALGWTTYDGDHMSMYAVNADVPKTLVKYLIEWVGGVEMVDASDLPYDIVDTPISPGVVPGNGEGEIGQKSEEILGPFELHDFYLYHFLRFGAGPEKLFVVARRFFSGTYKPEEILNWLGVFHERFFSQQFKRSCLPDGSKVGTVSLSPRTDWRMSSDISPGPWRDRIE